MIRLLIVDDEPLIVRGLANMIAHEYDRPTQIETAYDAIEALRLMETVRPDLLITDIHMPEMDGLELIRHTKERNLCEQCMILTGYGEFEYAQTAIRYGVVDYFLKPVNQAELLQAVGRMQDRIENAIVAAEQEQADSAPVGMANAMRSSKKIAQIEKYIKKHYMKDISLQEVSESVGLNPNYVSGLIHKETGTTFVQYVHRVRTSKAKAMLVENPDVAVEQVAVKVGYENSRQFFKVFKKFTGVTPGVYREKNSVAVGDDKSED
ncbi:helix-turn-helix protein [Cohnella sp. SGD-V74]|uniref:response regulator transcription factor n=1 Tax=unclassified Cohnella TaxID=2636738 RepID=UPI000D4B8FEB|nr:MULTISPECIES: response regulator [unclassified Cohnella]PRX65696.1 helix-turn-helix protein [Cohnella sp. SGD-V74]